MPPGYTVRYRAERLCGEPGWSYECIYNGRVVFEGWSRGSKREAEAEVRNGIHNREALLGATQQGAN